MNIEVKKVKLSHIKLNPDNPRHISNKDMERLVKSLTEFPEMMDIREIVVDENFMCIGGNMRTLALRKAGAKECVAKIVTGLTPEQKREFVIKDNSAFGSWDMDALANTWSDLPLADWGLGLPEDWLKDNPITNPKEETERYKLIFDFEKDDASLIQTELHKNLTKHKEDMDEHWRERCLLRMLKLK